MSDITYWLRKQPQPTAVLADDKRIEVGKNGRAWRDLKVTIEAMEPSKLTCLDKDGNILRVKVLAADEETSSTAAPSAEMSDLQLFAKLLAEAYDKASSKMQPIVDSAMAFVERGGTRLAKVEAENDRLRAHLHKLNGQIAELTALPASDAPQEETIVGAMIAGAMQAAGQQAAAQSPTPVTHLKGKAK